MAGYRNISTTATTLQTEIISQEILKSMNKLSEISVPDNFVNRPLPLGHFGGMKVFTEPQVPKIKLREHIQVSDEFRREMNAWLAARFGYRESICGNSAYVARDFGMMVMSPQTLAMWEVYYYETAQIINGMSSL